MAPAALRMGFEPVALREIVYQAVDYLGIGRVFPFIKAMNECFEAAGIVAVISSNLPFIGYPRTLNALAIVDEIMPTE